MNTCASWPDCEPTKCPKCGGDRLARDEDKPWKLECFDCETMIEMTCCMKAHYEAKWAS